jgi:hypothetical protein
MPVYPSSISSYKNATQGEKHLHRIFQELYGDSEEVYVWYEPDPIKIDNGQKRYTDFVIYSPDFGIILLEVKDWFKSTIQKISKDEWVIIDTDGKAKPVHSPFDQARTCFFGLKNTLEKNPIMLSQEDKYKNKLCLPLNYAVVFTKIENRYFVKAGAFFDLHDERQILTKDDIDIDIKNPADLKQFENKLIQVSQQCFFPIKFLIENQIKVLKSVLRKEIVIPPVPNQPIDETNINDLNVLDKLQDEFASTLGIGFHKIVKGVVGSGKTLVLAYRAFFLQKYYPEYKKLFVCYNKSLRRYFEFLIKNIEKQTNEKIYIEILHYHDLVSNISGQSSRKINDETSDEWDERIGNLLLHSANPKYDAILIDEAQDFSTLWLKGIRKLLTDSEELLLAFDPAQDIYKRGRVWSDADINLIGGGGAKSKILKIAYRNTNNIIKLAINFRGLNNYVEDSNGDTDELIKPVSKNKIGDKPILKAYNNLDLIVSNIYKEIRNLVNNGYDYKDIAIISVSPGVNNYFKNHIDSLESFIDNFIKTNNTINLSIEKNSVKALTAHSSKGLEWKVVYLLGVDDLGSNYNSVDSIIVYIGITRAKEKIIIPYRSQNEFIDKLVEINR